MAVSPAFERCWPHFNPQVNFYQGNPMKQLLCALVLLSISSFAHAGKYFATDGIAIRGYDPVGYFENDQALQGSKDFQYQWSEVTWYFSSAKHRDLFKAEPEKYAPQFGGYCALGAAHFGAVPTNPEAFTIHKGKLYFNMTQPVVVTWRLNPDFHVARASKAWNEGKIRFY